MATTGRFFPVQTMHLGPVGNIRTFNESSLVLPGTLGSVIEQDGKLFRLVLFDNGTGNVASIDGGVAYWKTKSSFTITSDASDSEGGADEVAGGFHAVITDGNYCFVQMGGDQAAVVVAANTVAGDHMSGHASTDNALTRTAAGTAAVDKQAATALSTRGTTTSDVGASVANSSKVRWVVGNLL